MPKNRAGLNRYPSLRGFAIFEVLFVINPVNIFMNLFSMRYLRGHCPLFFRQIGVLIIGWAILLLGPFTVLAGEVNEIIVKFDREVEIQKLSTGDLKSNRLVIDEIFAKEYFQTIKKLFEVERLTHSNKFNNIYKIAKIESDSFQTLLQALESEKDILWAEPNYIFPIHQIPNDSLYPQQWPLDHLRMTQAWDIEKGNPQVIVGIIDTGIDYLHEDLAGQLWVNATEDLNSNGKLDSTDINGIDDDGNGYVDDVIGWDFTDAPAFPDGGDYLNPDNNPMDEYPGGHGTPIAGIVSAVTDNLTGIAGIAPGAKLMALRAGTSTGFLEEDDVAEAILYAVENGCKIINMSFGDVVYSHLIKDAVDYGVNNGVIFVASAGNSGNNVLHFPAGYDETIAVGATNIDRSLAPFSNFGSKIEVVAPGQDIISTSNGGEYSYFNGTSFSAPMVSGVLALLWSQDVEASSERIRSRLISGCTDLGVPGWDGFFGNGLINAYRSLIQVEQSVAQILQPATLNGTDNDQVIIIGTATGPDMKRYQISFGIGEDPVKLDIFSEGTDRIIEDTLGVWHTSQLVDTTYTIELKVINWDLGNEVHRVVLFLDRTPPELVDLNILPMFIGNFNGYLIEIETDDRTVIQLRYRESGASRFNLPISSGYFNHQHHFLLSGKEFTNSLEFYLEIENTAQLNRRYDNNGDNYNLYFSSQTPSTIGFTKVAEFPGSGYFFNKFSDLEGDGKLDIFGNIEWPDRENILISHLSIEDMILQKNTGPIPAFTRDLFDVDDDGKLDLFAGYGAKSYLFPGEGLPSFTVDPIESTEDDFWAARIWDFYDDGNIEIVALHQNVWYIYDLLDPSQFSVKKGQTLSNPSAGENNYGVPQVEIADLNNNGRLNLVIGDYDGDLIVYEASVSGQFLPITHMKLPGEDATHRFAVGNFDDDVATEIAIATQNVVEYIGESSLGRQYWIFNILQLDDNNTLNIEWEQNFHGIVDHAGIYSGVSSTDYDGDGRDEIFFTPYPQAYFLEYEADSYQVRWYHYGVNSNVVPQISTNRILLPTDSSLIVWEIQSIRNRPDAPAALRVESADTAHIRLAWKPVLGSDYFLITRTDLESQIKTEYQSSENSYTDSLVVKGNGYKYQIQTVDSAFTNPLSEMSEALQVRSENPPILIEYWVNRADQILLEFSEKLGPKSFQVNKFWISPDSMVPSSVLRGKDSRQLLLSFLKLLKVGEHQLHIHGLENRYGVPFLLDTLSLNIFIAGQEESPFLRKVEMVSKKKLKLIFNNPMEQQSVENVAHYRIEPDDEVLYASLDSIDQKIVYLELSGQNRMGSLGVDYYLEFSELKDTWGQSVRQDWGNRHLIKIVQKNLDNVIVYPNPLKAGMNKGNIVFGNLPVGTTIVIYTANGEIVKQFENSDISGGIWWDLYNDKGQQIQNGVYLYLMILDEEKKSGKFVILR